MNKSLRIFGLLILASAANVAGAAENDGVRIVTKDASGQSTGTVAVTTDSKIKFTDEGIAVYEGEAQLASFAYDKCATISFLSPGSGIEAVDNGSDLVLLTNPAYDQLLFSGYENVSAPLAVFSVNGQRMVYVKNWQGQPVDVSHLTPGLYLISVNNSTFKFIKK